MTKLAKQPKKRAVPKHQLALLIAGHNEKLVIEKTIRSAINAGMQPQHIYVVDDCSDDNTRALAAAIIGRDNTMRVRRSGKGLALTKASKKFHLVTRYRWIHIADADGGFAQDYFKIFRKSLRSEYAAATGYVRSLPGESVSQYRVVEYTIGMEIHRRFQALTHTVSVIPGPTSCFRSDVFAKVNFANKSLTEDFDVTLQIHRQKLGRVQFIPKAIAYTQDPRTLKDFTKQITRWNRGIMQGVTRHRIGLRPQRIDAYLSYQVMQNLLLFLNYFVLLPYMAIRHHSLDRVALAFLFDVAVMFMLTFLIALKTNRKDILSAFPQIYCYRWVTLGVFLRAFTEVVILRKFRVSEGSWENRRYKSAMTV
ncbi:MAG TPA: glycosyltransferase family 2 protein [Candidatus Saccharimonadales bacterium]|nr:glycosyltransferase family 2 protein [Candidatus Saccharimonadales bacterium]